MCIVMLNSSHTRWQTAFERHCWKSSDLICKAGFELWYFYGSRSIWEVGSVNALGELSSFNKSTWDWYSHLNLSWSDYWICGYSILVQLSSAVTPRLSWYWKMHYLPWIAGSFINHFWKGKRKKIRNHEDGKLKIWEIVLCDIIHLRLFLVNFFKKQKVKILIFGRQTLNFEIMKKI